MADLKEVQKKNAKHIVEQFQLVRKELQHKVNDEQLDELSATLTAALWASNAGAKANGLVEPSGTATAQPLRL